MSKKESTVLHAWERTLGVKLSKNNDLTRLEHEIFAGLSNQELKRTWAQRADVPADLALQLVVSTSDTALLLNLLPKLKDLSEKEAELLQASASPHAVLFVVLHKDISDVVSKKLLRLLFGQGHKFLIEKLLNLRFTDHSALHYKQGVLAELLRRIDLQYFTHLLKYVSSMEAEEAAILRFKSAMNTNELAKSLWVNLADRAFSVGPWPFSGEVNSWSKKSIDAYESRLYTSRTQGLFEHKKLVSLAKKAWMNSVSLNTPFEASNWQKRLSASNDALKLVGHGRRTFSSGDDFMFSTLADDVQEALSFLKVADSMYVSSFLSAFGADVSLKDMDLVLSKYFSSSSPPVVKKATPYGQVETKDALVLIPLNVRKEGLYLFIKELHAKQVSPPSAVNMERLIYQCFLFADNQQQIMLLDIISWHPDKEKLLSYWQSNLVNSSIYFSWDVVKHLPLQKILSSDLSKSLANMSTVLDYISKNVDSAEQLESFLFFAPDSALTAPDLLAACKALSKKMI